MLYVTLMILDKMRYNLFYFQIEKYVDYASFYFILPSFSNFHYSIFYSLGSRWFALLDMYLIKDFLKSKVSHMNGILRKTCK